MNEIETPRGMSTTTKVVLIVLVCVGTLSLLCCGGGAWIARKSIRVTQDGEQVRQQAEEIMHIDIPEQLKPAGGFQLKPPFSMKWFPLNMKMVTFISGGEAGAETLILMEMIPPEGLNEEQLEDSMRQQARSRGAYRLNVEKEEARTFQIDGKDREFRFVTGTDPKTNLVMHEVTGVFPGRQGYAFFMLAASDKNWDEMEVEEMIRSITTQ